jgi:hypothetical protein
MPEQQAMHVAVSQQFLELTRGEACIMNNTAHGVGVNRIMPWDRKESNTIRHDYVFALPNDSKPRLPQSTHSIHMRYARKLSHDSKRLHLFHGFQHQETGRL